MIRRSRLLELLESARGRPLILISAPAGYGKTTLVQLWLNTFTPNIGWLSLDAYDDSLGDFVAYLYAAVASCAPGFGQANRFALEMTPPPSAVELANLFLRDLAEIDKELFIVLDDFHVLHAPAVHRFVERIVEYLPDPVHLIVITRADPPLRLPRLRGRGQMVEIRSAQLRFSQHEASQLLEVLLDAPVSPEVVGLLTEITEGWPVGLQLAALSLSRHADHDSQATVLARQGSQFVADYLVNEVLLEMPAEERDFLLRCSILDQMCAPLCNAITGKADAATLLVSFWRRNLFVVALDDSESWYRFHHLFRSLLRHRLESVENKAGMVELHNRASNWFETQGNVEQAVLHSIEAGNIMKAGRLVETRVHEALNQEQWRKLEHWLNLLPADAKQRPGLMVAEAWLEHFRFRQEALLSLVAVIEKRLDTEMIGEADERASLIANIYTLRAGVLLLQNRPQESFQASRLALTTLPANQVYVRGIAEHHYARGLFHTGNLPGAIDFIHQMLTRQDSRPDARSLRLLLGQGAIQFDQGDTNALEETAQTLYIFAQRTGHPVSMAWANAFSAWVRYQRNELVSAAEHYSKVFAAAHAAHFRCVLESHVGYALTLNAQSRRSDAHGVAEQLTAWLAEHNLVAMLPAVRALHAKIDLAAGFSPRGQQLPIRTGTQLDGLAMTIMPALVQVQIWLLRDEPDDLAKAGQLLVECRSAAEEMNLQRRLTEISALEALHRDAIGMSDSALTCLSSAVAAAEHMNALRILVDLGPALRPLLQRLHVRNRASTFLPRLLACYATPTEPARPLLTLNSTNDVAIPADTMLTNRETEVLLLLAERLTNKEIAHRLTLTPRTVKKHTINIYQKLHVDNRRAAVSHARALGILPPL